ncbi:MAG TPA: hypothetical protein VMS65_01550 [Polyangiaceae bacterium]|nr:hypothetical protein [Polyangiaceae bacterium]
MSHSNRTVLRRLVALGGLGALAAGCLDRPVTPAKPRTTNLFVEAVTQTFVDKIDLLFMIDNSLSMKDKQEILVDAVPVLVQRLVTPRCLDDAGNSVGMADTNGTCSAGNAEFKPVKDIHIGVITSSLGSHGGSECQPLPDDATRGRTPDDRAELLPLMRPAGLASWNGSGFLAWDPGQDKNNPPGESNLGGLVDNVRAQVRASGEIGCGYESSLEAWYRFLVDPEPPTSINVVDKDGVRTTQKGPVNTALLAQRAAFLRPDSLVAVVMLTDENDCSIIDDDGRQGFLVTTTGSRLPRSSAQCADDPNDACCHSCALPAAEGCTPNDQDAECSKKAEGEGYASLTANEDKSNLRCFDHKRRFGLDLLYPTQRYVDALTRPTVKNRAGENVTNPLFAPAAGGRARPDSQVILAGIVGVPWQDIATEGSRESNQLEYLSAAGLKAAGRWDLILGDARANEQPLDPHMRESVSPRSGTNPVLGVPIAPATSQNPTENPINGHEQNVPGFDDLQYACTFELPAPQPCNASNDLTCECNASDQVKNSSLCEYPNGPNTDGVQRFAKAYPGLRHLEVLKGVGDNAIVASICPKNVEPAPGLAPASDPSYGYNPAVASILDIIGDRIGNQCLPRRLEPDTNPESETFGKVPCNVIEAVHTDACACDATKGRSPLKDDLRAGAHDALRGQGDCGGDTGVDCNSYCLCEVEQLTGSQGEACLDGSKDPNLYGYCYVDAEQGLGNPELVATCEPNKKRVLRWVGEGLPANGSTMLMACLGAPL